VYESHDLRTIKCEPANFGGRGAKNQRDMVTIPAEKLANRVRPRFSMSLFSGVRWFRVHLPLAAILSPLHL
jgi:hypothetical protein